MLGREAPSAKANPNGWTEHAFPFREATWSAAIIRGRLNPLWLPLCGFSGLT